MNQNLMHGVKDRLISHRGRGYAGTQCDRIHAQSKRMIVASFMQTPLIDWRWGEAYFANKLLDFDFAANNGGWQWAAGSGCDAAPYFRIFNPSLQTKKFDPELKYIRKWVPRNR